MVMLLIAAIAFVGTHFLLSHLLRVPLVERLGERAFLGLYSLVAVATLGWLVVAFRHAPETVPLWSVGGVLWGIATAIMLIASVLLVGSLFGNPALPDPSGAAKPVPQARGVFAITRHPMLWSFALWGLAHILVMPSAANIILAGAIIILSLVGASAQDAKKERLQPNTWPAWEARTSYWPFAALAAGRTSGAMPGIGVVIGGVLLWLAATWAHIPLVGYTAGIWQWIR